jgi:hypothetical protein
MPGRGDALVQRCTGRKLAGARGSWTVRRDGLMLLVGKTGSMPLGQSRPFDRALAQVSNKPLLAWAHSVGLIEVYADGSWHLSELALQWLCHQPIPADNGFDDPRYPCPDRYDA